MTNESERAYVTYVLFSLAFMGVWGMLMFMEESNCQQDNDVADCRMVFVPVEVE
jgi:hypothetical protein